MNKFTEKDMNGLNPNIGFDDMVESFGYGKPVVKEDYDGTTLFLFTDGVKYGYLCWGWGSCSNCRLWENFESLNDLLMEQEYLFNSIHWEPSAMAMKKWLDERDWKGMHEREVSEYFLPVANDVLAKVLNS